MLLYIDACPRAPEVSRTHQLGEAFLDEYAKAPGAQSIERVRLASLDLRPYDGAMVDRREALIDAGKTDDEVFDLARQFARADSIVIAAPYWDYSFPSMLKVYIEHIFARTIQFIYIGEEPIGLSAAKRMTLLTTAGGRIGARNGGGDYLKIIADTLGIDRFDQVSAELLDIEGADITAIMADAKKRARQLARTF